MSKYTMKTESRNLQKRTTEITQQVNRNARVKYPYTSPHRCQHIQKFHTATYQEPVILKCHIEKQFINQDLPITASLYLERNNDVMTQKLECNT